MRHLRNFIATHSRLLLFIGIFTMFFLWSYMTLDPDFGWHLRSGQYFIEHGIPSYDIFTYTAGAFHWVNHEWLSDVVVALVYGVGSFELLALLYAALWTSAFAILGRGVHAAFLVSGAVAVLPFAGVRALTWSVLGLALLHLIIRQRNKKWRLVIPFLFLVWANLHGSFLIGIAYGGWQVLREKSWRLLVIGVVSLAATFINPYGIEIYTEVFRTMFDSDLHATIIEWARFALPISAIPYTLVWLGLTVYRNRCDWKRYVQFETLLFVMAVTSMRMTPLFVLMSLRGLQQTVRDISDDTPKKYRSKQVQAATMAGVILVCVSLLAPVAESASGNSLSITYPERAVQYLTERPCNGNLFNSYNFGGYLIWQLPNHKVYIDGRMPSWEHGDGTYMKDYLRILDDESYRTVQFSQYDIGCVLVENTAIIQVQLKDQGWRTVVDDGYSSLLMRGN
ncbi:MAG TPA: hypothetical protein PKD28_00260 [Candidatus Saccharibacteria bacterium]|nr:hypothetical protein [Candidatus Saccharibacteria bacterium]